MSDLEKSAEKSVERVDKSEKFVQLAIRMPKELYNLIEEKIVPFYRVPTVTHAVRLMVEDIAEMIEQGKMQKITLQSIHEPSTATGATSIPSLDEKGC